jgi:hypothetical protein
MPIEDEQLDDLLRDVSVPHDLKAKLLQIPDREPESLTVARRSNSGITILGLLAAIAASVLVFFNLPAAPVDVDENVSVAISNEEEIEGLESLLAQLDEERRSIELLSKARELDRSRLELLNEEPHLKLEESLALAMSLSWESSLDRGASIESVRSELEYVASTFPNTKGAEIARNILQPN